MDEPASLDAYLFYRHEREPSEEPTSRAVGQVRSVPATDGYPLAVSVYEPASPTTRVVVIASATAVKRSYYAAFAAWLARTGVRVVTFDYRGIGGSRPRELASLEASLVDWGERDLSAVLAWAAKTYGDGKTDAVVHSVGGQLLGLVPDPSMVRHVVMVGSQSGDLRLWPAVTNRVLFGALWYAVVPMIASTLGYLPGSLGIGEDLPGGVAREWARWCRTPGYVVGGADGAARREGYRRLGSPVLAFGFEDDDYAPTAAVDALLALYDHARITRRHVPASEHRVGHFGFFRARFEHTLWREAAAFLEQLPS